LFLEYLQWATGMDDETGADTVDSTLLVDHDMADIQRFMPPVGRLLLANDDTGVFGCACMRTIRVSLAEVKRVYVRPEQRRSGVGRAWSGPNRLRADHVWITQLVVGVPVSRAHLASGACGLARCAERPGSS